MEFGPAGPDFHDVANAAAGYWLAPAISPNRPGRGLVQVTSATAPANCELYNRA